MASCLQDSEEKTNGSKLSRLLIDGGTFALRQVFDSFHPPSSLGTSLHSHLPLLTTLRHRKVVNARQWDMLFPPTGALPDSKRFDITLLFVLLRNICGLTSPATGWNSLPPLTDMTLEANLARIKYYRNEVYGHISSTGINRPDFENFWKDISGALTSLGLDQISIDILKTSPLGTADYLRLLEEWSFSEQSLKEITEKTQKEMYKARQTAEETKEEVCKIRETVEQTKIVTEAVKAEAAKTNISLKESVGKIDQLLAEVNGLNQKMEENGSKFAHESNISKLFRYNSSGYVNFLFKLFHPGTREWVFEKLWQCLDNEISNCALITAQPGMGKSVLAALACKNLQNDNKLAACHFIQHDNSLTNDPRNIIESVVKNLCETVPNFRQKLIESLARNTGKEFYSLSCKEMLTVLLEEPLNAVDDPYERKVVVIDALDECAPKQKDEFVKALFNAIPKLPKWLLFILTTRPLPDVIPIISTVQVIEMNPESPQNTKDIELYLTSRVCTHFKDTSFEQVESVVEKLLETCDGSFLVARFVVDSAREQVREPSQVHMIFPQGISSVYEEYFKRVLSEITVDENRFFTFLEVIVAAQEPLPETLALRILGINGDSHDAIKTARSTLKGLSNLFPSYDGHITLFHKSVYDWLTKDSRQSKQHSFSVGTRNGHRVLAAHCYEYLQHIALYKTVPPDVTDCEKYALKFGIQHMMMSGECNEQISKCVKDLNILTALYSTSVDEWFGMRNLCDQLEKVTDASLMLELNNLITNLKCLRYVSCKRYPQAVLQAAVFCPSTREQAVRLLSSSKYDFGYIDPTQKQWELPANYEFIINFKVSCSNKFAVCIGCMKNHTFFAATLDAATGKCIAVVVQSKEVLCFSAAQLKPCVCNVVQGAWRPVNCSISPDDKYVCIVTFFNIELRLSSSLQMKKTLVVDSEPNTCCFLSFDRKLVAGY